MNEHDKSVSAEQVKESFNRAARVEQEPTRTPDREPERDPRRQPEGTPKREAERASQKKKPDIATKSALDWRIAQRARPKPGMELTPGGTIQKEVDKEVDMENERRIKDLSERLERAGRRFRRNWDRSR